ncbi:retention module-containing protein [Photobacterium leiognathi]|uniref:retention module-containing protein n=1 Tax=Photobacterium leiognathi TaxID=553611 RepID=UPI001EDE1B77|nr:retention module-containing protein [Photobacterium leiognathi]MCG3884952.1 retention module-containing protein [Photobacterium leiognathi]
MKAINLKESIILQDVSGEAFVLKSDGSLAPLHAGMNINTGTIIVLTDNGTISAIDKTGAPAELSYELIQNIQLPTSYEHIFSVTDGNAIDDESLHIAEQTTAAIDDLQKIHDAILDGIDPTKVQQATAAGNENSSNWGVVTIDYDNDKMLAEAGFDTAYQPGTVEYPEDYSGLNDHLSIEASITIDSISQDDVVTAAESNAMQTITGTVGGDVKAGDIVTVTLDGKEIGKATVVNNNGKLEWSLDVDGKTLLQAGIETVSATVTTNDDVGNSATATTTHDYTIDIQASITIDPITGDNVITQQEGHEPTLPITGTVGKDVLPGDTVTVTINGNEYTTTVQPDMSWTVNVTGDDILHADKATASVTTSYGSGHEATATDTESYEVTIEAKVTIETIAGDGVVNQEESEGKVPVTGTVGGDVKEGDTVTITVNGKDYTTTVGKDGSWTVNVDGKDLIEHGGKPIEATVTTCDGAGHCANGEDEKGYDIDTTITADVEITVIAGDDYLNEDEAKGTVSITGTVGGDVKEGDVVTLTVDGKEIGTAIVEKNEAGALVWTATGIDGETLANAKDNQVTANVTATDDAGNSVTATNTHEYHEATLEAEVTITSIAGDNVLTGSEIDKGTMVEINGTVGGDVQAGATVIVTVEGVKHEVTVSDDLTWTLEVDGNVLANSKLPEVTANVVIKDKYGNTATDSDTDDYTVDIQASITIDKITGDNVITQQEGHEAFLPVTGTVGKDVREGDTVTVTINGNEYHTTVKPDLTWEVEVTGNDILHADKATASVTTSYGTDKEVTVSAEQEYEVVIEATVTIETIGDGDDWINQEESEGKVPVTGTTGGDVKEGDTVTVTVNGKDYKTTVGKDGSWTVDVDGKDLVENGDKTIQATVTTCDGAGHCASDEDDKGYDIDTEITADVEITVIAGDDYLNEDEAKGTVSISGTVGGDVKEGDVVTLTVDGKEIGTAIVEKNEAGDLVWTATGIDGETLANAKDNQVTANVTATDDAGNSVTATNTHEYHEATLEAEVTITSIAGDDALNATEVKPGTMVEINGTVGGDVKAGATVIVTVEGVKHEVTVKDDLTWTLEVDGSVLAGSKKHEVTADVVIKDKYGNTAKDDATHGYIIPTLDVDITIDSVNGGEPITGEEHDANTPIKVTGSVGGDAKEGDTVTLHIGENTVETTVIVLENGELGYIVDVPAGMFEPDSNDGFSGDITADITINDKYGNTASANDEKDFDTIGSVITGGTSGDDLHGTGYNDLIIGDDYVEKTNVNVNLVLDISGSMSMREVNVNNIHLNNNHTSGTLTLKYKDGGERHIEFDSIDTLAAWLNNAYGAPREDSYYTPDIKFTFPDGSTQVVNDVYDDIGVDSRINLAKNSVLEIVENYGESLDAEQLRNLEFSMITFATGVDTIQKFHWDFNLKTLVSKDGQTIADFLTHVEPLKGDDGKTDYDSSIVAAINGFTNTNTSNVIYFVTDGMDTVTDKNNQIFDINAVINNAGGSIDKFKPTIVPVAIGATIGYTPAAKEVLDSIASLGQGYKPDNTGNSQVIIATNTAQLGDVVNESFDNIISGNDTIHGGKGNDFIVGDTLNNDWLVQQYGSGYTHMADLIDSGVTLSEVLFTVAAKDQGVDVDKLTTKDVYQFVIKHQDTLVIEGDNPSNGLDKIFGDEGQDILFGSGNNDILTGGTGDDLMFGQNGDDILVSDSGSDILFGGKGNDIFKLDVLATDEKTLTSIQDFEKGDSINIESILDSNASLDDLLSHVSSAEVDGKDVNIVFDDKHKVELKDIKNVYSELGTSTSEIVTQLFNNDVFTNHH